MPFNLTVSPDFKPEFISSWFIFNTWLQKSLNEQIHLEIYSDFKSLSKAIDDKNVDLIYANPNDIPRLIREEGFTPIAKPITKADEAIIATSASSEIESIDQLKTPLAVALTDSPEVNTIGSIMLESADLDKSEITTINCLSYVVVAKNILNNQAGIGYFLADAYNELSALVKKQLKPLISSKIQMIHHALLLGPGMKHLEAPISEIIINMHNNESGKKILEDLQLEQWAPLGQEDTEFLIDLLDTLATD